MNRWDAAWEKPEPQRSNGAPLITAAPGSAAPYALAALRSEAETVAATPNGKRNDALNTAAFRMARHVGAGNIDVETVRTTLASAGRACGLPEDEIDLILRNSDDGALNQGQTVPRHPAPLPELPRPTVLDVPDLTAHESDDFWGARAHLEHIHSYARARRVSPWATLGVVLARVVTATPYHVVLPPIVGGIGSLNLFVGLVGRSGSGKGAAESVAAECFDVGVVETHKTGSGEGIAHGYRHREKGGVEWNDERHAVLFSVPEIDTLSALGNRQGATLMPELRSAWSGERLGFGYADPTKRLPVPSHEYRLCLVAGIQPGRAQALLEDADGGTPQRFLWMPASDPDAPEELPECPDPMRWTPPNLAPKGNPHFVVVTGQIRMDVCAVARRTIDGARLARLRGDGEALDGHGLLTRLKVAAALALADSGRLDINDEDWDLAGTIHRKSDATRAGVQQALSAATEQRNEARAMSEAKRSLIVAETVEDAAVKRVSRAVVRTLKKDEWVVQHELRKALASRDRGLFEEALRRLSDAGQVAAEETVKGMRYRLIEMATHE